MVTVMMSNDSNKLELDQRSDAVGESALNNHSRVSVDSVGNDEDHDAIGSEEEARVSTPLSNTDSKNDIDGTSVVDFMDDKSNINVDKSNSSGSGKKTTKGKGKGTKVEHKQPSDLDHNSMLAMFDEYVNNGNKWSVGHGYEIGDMVWGKVKSHPWWPGHVYNEAFATPSVRRSKTEGHVLVAFFGDSSYGYFDPAEMVPFEANYAEKSKQTNLKSFIKAVQEALDELSRRTGLGLACRCRNPYNFRATNVEGFFTVDVGDESGGIFSASQIKRARNGFQPQEMVSFLKKVAMEPRAIGLENIDIVKRKATVLAYRKAVFEEFDETYAQAFGAQPVRPERKTEADLAKEPSRAPLKGRLVIAETLGKGKGSRKSTKTKEQLEKEKYVFKRRDEPISTLKAHKKSKAQPGSSNSQPLQIDGTTSTPQKGKQTDTTEQLLDQSASVEARELGPNGDSESGAVRKPKKGKGQKRPAVESSSKDSVSIEKKKKRKKEEIGIQISSDTTTSPSSAIKVEDLLIQVPSAADGDSDKENHEKDPFQVTLPDDEDPKMEEEEVQKKDEMEDEKKDEMEIEKKDDATAIVSVLPPQHTVGTELLRQLHRDLCALALINPSHGVVRNSPQTVRKVFMKFRSLVFQKSLDSLVPTGMETESIEATPAVKEITPVKPPPQRIFARPDDPTIGGRKRGTSDRQEEMAAKKKKKVNDLKSLAAEKKAALKAPPEASPKEVPARSVFPKSTKMSRPGTVKKEVVVKRSEPTMLLIKFPPGGNLPSQPELKAKFARFGPLDPSKIRTYWKSFQCRLVYQQKSHAQAALRYATGNNSPFGKTKVRCYLRDMSGEAYESELAKVVVKREDGSSSSRSVEQRQASNVSSPLKSILRRSSGDEGVPSPSPNNNGGRGSRVKFALSGEEDHLNVVGNKSSDGGASSSSSTNAKTTMDFNSKNFQNVVSQQIPATNNMMMMHVNDGVSRINRHYQPNTTTSMHKYNAPPLHLPLPLPLPPPPPMQQHYQTTSMLNYNAPPLPLPPPPPPVYHQPPVVTNVDITQPMLSLLLKCNDVVNNLTSFLGYMPYHPL